MVEAAAGEPVMAQRKFQDTLCVPPQAHQAWTQTATDESSSQARTIHPHALGSGYGATEIGRRLMIPASSSAANM